LTFTYKDFCNRHVPCGGRQKPGLKTKGALRLSTTVTDVDSITTKNEILIQRDIYSYNVNNGYH